MIKRNLFQSFLCAVFCICSCYIYSQKWIKAYPEYNQNVVLKMLRISQDTSIVLLNGSTPGLLYIDNEGEVLKFTSVVQHLTYAYDMAVASEKILIVGKTNINDDDERAFLCLDLDGNLDWFSSEREGFYSSVISYEGDFIIGGNANKVGATSDYMLKRISAAGRAQWVQRDHLSGNSHAGKLLVDENRIFVINAAFVGSFNGIVAGEINPENGNYIWTQSCDMGIGFSKKLFDANYQHPYGAAISETSIFIAYPGNSNKLLCLTKGGQIIDHDPLQHNISPYSHSIEYTESELFIVGSSKINASYQNLIEKRTPSGQLVWRQEFDQGTLFASSVSKDQILVGGMVNSYYEGDDKVPLIASLSRDGDIYNSGITFSIQKDTEGDCLDANSVPCLDEVDFFIDNEHIPKDGNRTLPKYLPIGSYKFSYRLPPYLSSCNWPEEIQVTSTNTLKQLDLIANEERCADLHIAITETNLVRGKENDIILEYNNKGNQTIQDVSILLQLDPRLMIVETSLSLTRAIKRTITVFI